MSMLVQLSGRYFASAGAYCVTRATASQPTLTHLRGSGVKPAPLAFEIWREPGLGDRRTVSGPADASV